MSWGDKCPKCGAGSEDDCKFQRECYDDTPPEYRIAPRQAIPTVAQAERVWHRKDCPFCGSPDGQYSASLQDLPAAFFCKGCGINAAQPPAAPVETCKTCNGRREVGGFDRGDNAYRSEPCPECSPQRSSAASEPVAYRWHFRGERAWTLVHSDPGNVEGTVVQPLYLAVPQPVVTAEQVIARMMADNLREPFPEFELIIRLVQIAANRVRLEITSPLSRPERSR